MTLIVTTLLLWCRYSTDTDTIMVIFCCDSDIDEVTLLFRISYCDDDDVVVVTRLFR